MWMMPGQLQATGVGTKLEAFPILRIDLDDTFHDIDGRRIGGVPLFAAGFTLVFAILAAPLAIA
jgi:hypothetical protein